ncbi:hypothetical protein EC968_005387 [Mortierella alpina]|nr:hypothetical protein EC968_005387 [Mortierella alpina]
MKFSLKAVAISALLASIAVAAPVDVEKRDAASDRIAACFVGLIFTGAWPGSCQAAVAVNLGLIRSIAVNQMTMDFTPADPWKPTTSSNNIVATMLSIPGINLPIDSVRQHIILTDNNVQIGNIDTPWSSASVKNGALTTSFSTSTLNVFPTSHAAFSNFIGSLSTKVSHPVTLQGSVDAKLNLGIFGHLTIPGIGFKTTTQFAGMNNLPLKYVYMVDTDFASAPGFIKLTTIVNISNPSKLTLKLGDITLNAASEAGHVGKSSIKNLSLVPGENYVISTTALDMSIPAAEKFLSEILPNKDGVLTLTGFDGTSTDLALNAGLAIMKSNLVVPQNFLGSVMSQSPYKDFSLQVLPGATAEKVAIQLTATFQSPYYGYPFELTHASPDGASSALITEISSGLEGRTLFNFEDNFTFKVGGTGSVTVKFTASLSGPFDASSKAAWTEMVDFATKNGHLPVNLVWLPNIILNGDGIERVVEWNSASTPGGVVKLKTGADLASVLKVFPA